MFYLWFIIVWISLTSSISGQQFYDSSECSSQNHFPGSRYTCNSSHSSCKTYLVYRANKHFQTIEDISDLLNVNSDEVLDLNKNNLVSNSSEIVLLKPGKEVLVPIDCSCSGDMFFQANTTYFVTKNTTFSEIACGVFEGLVKSLTLSEENPLHKNMIEVGSELNVPLKCACPNVTSGEGVKYLVTYPFIEGDTPRILSKKFNISIEKLWEFNQIDYYTSTVYPNTTILVPLGDGPISILDVTDPPPPPADGFLPLAPVEDKKGNGKPCKWCIAGSVSGVLMVVFALLSCGLYKMVLKKRERKKIESLTPLTSPALCSPTRSSPFNVKTGRSSANSCLSPDLLVEIKYSLFIYTIEDLRKATNGFSEENKTGPLVYKGLVNNVLVMIKKVSVQDSRRVIDVHSKINHINILSLLGACYSEGESSSWSYLVFEFPENGCLKECLSNSLTYLLKWQQRTQIAFDIATALHYLINYCTSPSNVEVNMCSRNIFVTSNWRAKLAISDDQCTPTHGSVLAGKAHIFGFGLVLLEIISAREEIGGKPLKDCIGFLGGEGSEGGSFEGLRSFVDPNMKDDYPLAEVLCLAVLAKACVAEDPLQRPTMDDIIKVLAKMVNLTNMHN